jgi:7-carboxy-7-deazaguanine synthase
MHSIKVCEIFASIQGESTHAGRPCIFIRLTGCNLRCSYCDTKYAYEVGNEMSIDTILSKVSAYGIKLVEVTGGEPLLQSHSILLITQLCNAGYEVLIETNGSRDIKPIDPRAKIIMDVKTPSSGMVDTLFYGNLTLLKPHDEVKFVLANRQDYEWALHFMHKENLIQRCTVLLSPVFHTLQPSLLITWIIQDCLPVRLNLQLHKYIWPPDQRGV